MAFMREIPVCRTYVLIQLYIRTTALICQVLEKMRAQASSRSDVTLRFSMATGACDLAITGMGLIAVAGLIVVRS